MQYSKEQFLEVVHRWDQRACCLIRADQRNFDEAVGIFCVPKDNEHDRLIINPRTINSRMWTISDYIRELTLDVCSAFLGQNLMKSFVFLPMT